MNGTMLRRGAEVGRRWLSTSSLATRAALRVRDHLTGIIFHRLGHDTNPLTNGEMWLIDLLAPDISLFVDVGANVGEWTTSVLEKAPSARGIVLDPSTEAYDELQRTLGSARVEVLHAAAGDVAGRQTFYQEPRAGRTSSLYAAAAAVERTAHEVDVVTLDQLVAAGGVERIDLLKIDAEGHDLRILEGSHRLLTEQRVGVVQFEYNVAWQYAGCRLKDAEHLLQRLGYRMLLLKNNGVYTFPYDIYGDFYHYANFIGVSRRLMRRISAEIRGEI